MSPIIVWFRNDLRLTDNPALHAAAQTNKPIIPIYLWVPSEESPWPFGAASCWWLHYSLQNLKVNLSDKNLQLTIQRGESSLGLIQRIIQETGAKEVYWNHRYEPMTIARDQQLKGQLEKEGIQVQTFNGSLLSEPWEILNKQKKPFQVFGAYWKAFLKQNQIRALITLPSTLVSYPKKLASISLDNLNLLPGINWTEEIAKEWTPGEKGALHRLHSFLKLAAKNYTSGRDIPSTEGVSRLSPHLQFGEISPHQIWYALQESPHDQYAEPFLRQLGWRNFAHYLLYHYPHTMQQPLRPKFQKFPFVSNKEHLKAWQKGLTGYPIVDAGMRQLWRTGWMHNRVRMIVGSFLVKDLLISWYEGAEWFWDTLVDANLANNTMGWQWIAGCGADASPYFRIFNPTTQGEKFDPEGKYIRRWIPELAFLPDKWIHTPWLAPTEILQKAKVELGMNYPYPIVDHAEARDTALAALRSIREK
ncbi:MAG: phrB [Chlamydiales bacterium]|jgi:deoxyribodipyrimidine photo-lyase|nr:phrB [Chlamydiales bacterium]